ncbi:MAG: hypothetical protein OEM67_02880 [Thermoleophilia bacterium]|nr:hypothetical protein [Thermoleophilia bacterium]
MNMSVRQPYPHPADLVRVAYNQGPFRGVRSKIARLLREGTQDFRVIRPDGHPATVVLTEREMRRLPPPVLSVLLAVR